MEGPYNIRILKPQKWMKSLSKYVWKEKKELRKTEKELFKKLRRKAREIIGKPEKCDVPQSK